MTDEETAAEPVALPEKEIDFHGRKIWVTFPGPEKLLVWKRTLAKLQDGDTKSWDGAQAMAALERARKIIDSLLVNETDSEWLDDQMLAGKLDLIEAAQIIQLTTEAFTADDNRETRRAAAKKTAPKKATRKKAASR